MKKTLLIALCSLAVLFAACKPEPDPEPVDYAPNYVGDYLGQYTLTITSMNNQTQTGMSFPLEGIGMTITKGEEINAITASVTVGNETHYTNGTATAENFSVLAAAILKIGLFSRFTKFWKPTCSPAALVKAYFTTTTKGRMKKRNTPRKLGLKKHKLLAKSFSFPLRSFRCIFRCYLCSLM